MDNSSPKADLLRILVIDDEPGILKGLKTYLDLLGHEVFTAVGGKAGLEILRNSFFDVVLCDLKMPDVDGLSLLKEARSILADSTVIMMSAYGTFDHVIEAVQLGADDYIAKPFAPDELLLRINKAYEKQRLVKENRSLKHLLKADTSFSNIVGKCPSMMNIFERIERLAEYNTNVLLQGESGTGKELFAKAIHYNSSRKDKPFVAINCGAVPEHLLESELFGHKKGSFTDATRDKKGLFLEANLGTLFLDEIGEMPHQLQVKLLRAIQEREITPVGETKPIPIDIRLIAATLRDLEQDVIDGRFREDLYYRLNVISIHIPPLRERKEDIPILAEHLLKVGAKRFNIPPPRISSDVMNLFLNYSWPGNVRELENCLEHCLVLGDAEIIKSHHLPHSLHKDTTDANELTLSEHDLSIKAQTASLEKQLIIRALNKTNGNRTQAARLLNISQRALLYKMKDYEIDIPPSKN